MLAVVILTIVLFVIFIANEGLWSFSEWPFLVFMKIQLLYTALVVVITLELLSSRMDGDLEATTPAGRPEESPAVCRHSNSEQKQIIYSTNRPRGEIVVWFIRHASDDSEMCGGFHDWLEYRNWIVTPSFDDVVHVAWIEIEDCVFKIVEILIPDRIYARELYDTILSFAVLVCPEGFDALLQTVWFEDGIWWNTDGHRFMEMLKEHFGEEFVQNYCGAIVMGEGAPENDWVHLKDTNVRDLFTRCRFIYTLNCRRSEAPSLIRNNSYNPNDKMTELLRFVRWEMDRTARFTNAIFKQAKQIVDRCVDAESATSMDGIMRDIYLIISDLNCLDQTDLELIENEAVLTRLERNAQRLRSELKEADDGDIFRGFPNFSLEIQLHTLDEFLKNERENIEKDRTIEKQLEKKRQKLISRGDEEKINVELKTASFKDQEIRPTRSNAEAVSRNGRANFNYQAKMTILNRSRYDRRKQCPELDQILGSLKDHYTKMQQLQEKAMRQAFGYFKGNDAR